MCRDSVRRGKRRSGVKIPDDLTGCHLIRPQVTVHRTREDYALNQTGRSELRGGTARFSEARGFGRGSGPKILPVAASRANNPPPDSGLRAIHIRQRHISHPVVSCDSPQHATQHAAFADAGLPNDFPVLIGIESVHHACLLARYEDLLTAAGVKQHSGGTEVLIRSVIHRAVPTALSGAAIPIEHVRSRLLRPTNFSVLQIERDNRIGRLDIGIGIAVARHDVDQFPFEIDGGSGPYRRA